MKYKYPAALFIIGLFSDFFLRKSYLFVPAVILMLIGIRVKPCLYVGIGLLLLDAVLSVISTLKQRLKLKKTFETESPSESFTALQQAITSKGWIEGVKEFSESRIKKAGDGEE